MRPRVSTVSKPVLFLGGLVALGCSSRPIFFSSASTFFVVAQPVLIADGFVVLSFWCLCLGWSVVRTLCSSPSLRVAPWLFFLRWFICFAVPVRFAALQSGVTFFFLYRRQTRSGTIHARLSGPRHQHTRATSTLGRCGHTAGKECKQKHASWLRPVRAEQARDGRRAESAAVMATSQLIAAEVPIYFCRHSITQICRVGRTASATASKAEAAQRDARREASGEPPPHQRLKWPPPTAPRVRAHRIRCPPSPACYLPAWRA